MPTTPTRTLRPLFVLAILASAALLAGGPTLAMAGSDHGTAGVPVLAQDEGGDIDAGTVVLGLGILAALALTIWMTRSGSEDDDANKPGTPSAPAADSAPAGPPAQQKQPGGAMANLPSVFGLAGADQMMKAAAAADGSTAADREPEGFDMVRQVLTEIVVDIDAQDAEFVQPDMWMKRDLNLEPADAEKVLQGIADREAKPLDPELPKFVAANDASLRDILAVLRGEIGSLQEAGETRPPSQRYTSVSTQ